jgi:hypothetical protein
VIDEVDEALRLLVERELDGSGVETSFEAPTRDWAARRSVPTIDLYLYDIREDRQRRNVGHEVVYDEAGVIVARRLPSRVFRLSYLVTAWTQRTEDEHRLLSQMLACILRNEVIPRSLLTGTLAAQPHNVPMTVALPPSEDRSLSDVWTALGGELKPSLDVVIAAPIGSALSVPAGPPVLEEPRITVGDETPSGRRKAAKIGKQVAEESRADEVVRAGTEKQAGRVIRVRDAT